MRYKCDARLPQWHDESIGRSIASVVNVVMGRNVNVETMLELAYNTSCQTAKNTDYRTTTWLRHFIAIAFPLDRRWQQ